MNHNYGRNHYIPRDFRFDEYEPEETLDDGEQIDLVYELATQTDGEQ